MIANVQLGYGREGVAFRIHTGQAPQAPGTVPLYRLYKNNDHFYTISASERDNAVANCGYAFEGTAGFVFDSQKIPGLVPLHRLFNKYNGEHFYTTSFQEASNAVAGGYYVLEGTAAWVIP